MEKPPKECGKGESIEYLPHIVYIYYILHELDRSLFTTRMKQFTNYWSSKEPDFIKYFNTYYKERAGKYL